MLRKHHNIQKFNETWKLWNENLYYCNAKENIPVNFHEKFKKINMYIYISVIKYIYFHTENMKNIYLVRISKDMTV